MACTVFNISAEIRGVDSQSDLRILLFNGETGKTRVPNKQFRTDFFS